MPKWAIKGLTKNARPDLYLASNLSPEKTDLPYVVWFSQRGTFALDQFWIWISPLGKKALPSKMIAVSIPPAGDRILGGSLSAGELKLLRQWVDVNREVLDRYWEGEIDSLDGIEGIRPLLTASDSGLLSLLDRYKATNDPTEMRELSHKIERAIFRKQYENVE